MDFDKVLALVDAMNREGVEYITFGAVALAVHGLVRATEDADFFVRPTEENIERLKRALRSVWNDPSIDQISAAELSGDYPAIAYLPEGEEFGIDFLARLGEAYSYEGLGWEMGSLDGHPIRVVTAQTLYEMKRDTVRWKDKIDAAALRKKFFGGE